MSKTFIDDVALDSLASDVIAKEKLDYLNNIKIKYVLVAPEISKTIHGKCIKPNAELKHFGDFDILVEFSEKVWQSIDDQTRYILCYHELLHIVVGQDDKGLQKIKIVNHDIQDFSSIINRFGISWISEFKNIVSSTYELQGYDRDRIQI